MLRDEVRRSLDELGIQLVTETELHFLFVRENCIALVERRAGETGSIGGTGIMTAQGLAYLVWREGQPYLKSKSAEIPATEADVTEISRFSRDLETGLR